MKAHALEYADSLRMALWTSLALALGIVLHRLFLLVALAIALSASFRWLIDWVGAAAERTNPKHRHAE